MNGFLAGSLVKGSPSASTAIQRSSVHYFQRPDATRAQVDPSATALSGVDWRLQLDRQNGEHWTGSIWLAEVTKGFEINDLGFSWNREHIDWGFRAGYREVRAGRIFRDYDIGFNTFYNFSHEALDDAGRGARGGVPTRTVTFGLNSRFTFLNYHGGNVDLSYQPGFYSRTATRGQPVMIQPGTLGGRLGYRADRRRDTNFDRGLNSTRAAHDSGRELSVDGTLGLRPSSQFSLSIGPRFTVQTDRAQYVGSTGALPLRAHVRAPLPVRRPLAQVSLGGDARRLHVHPDADVPGLRAVVPFLGRLHPLPAAGPSRAPTSS